MDHDRRIDRQWADDGYDVLIMDRWRTYNRLTMDRWLAYDGRWTYGWIDDGRMEDMTNGWLTDDVLMLEGRWKSNGLMMDWWWMDDRRARNWKWTHGCWPTILSSAVEYIKYDRRKNSSFNLTYRSWLLESSIFGWKQPSLGHLRWKIFSEIAKTYFTQIEAFWAFLKKNYGRKIF